MTLEQASKGMREVPKSEFFKRMTGDVQPHIVNSWDQNGEGYVSQWKTKHGSVVGASCSGVRPFTLPRWFLPMRKGAE